MEPLPINGTDIVIVALLVISGVLAFVRGFVHEMLAVAGWVGAAFATIYLFPHAQTFARQYLEMKLVADALTGITIFVVTLAVLTWLSHVISKRVRNSALNAVDRSLGFVFGLLRGALLVSIAWLGLAAFVEPEDHPAFIQEARSLRYVVQVGNFLKSMVPDETLAIGRDFVDDAADQSGELVGDRIIRLVDPSGNDPKSTDSKDNTGYKRAPRKQLQRLIEDQKD